MSNLISRRPVIRAFNRSNALALGLALCAISAAVPASAAKVYRCGNVFQDQPCPEVKIASAAPVERTPTIVRDVPCATRDGTGRGECAPKAPAPRDVPTDIRR